MRRFSTVRKGNIHTRVGLVFVWMVGGFFSWDGRRTQVELERNREMYFLSLSQLFLKEGINLNNFPVLIYSINLV